MYDQNFYYIIATEAVTVTVLLLVILNVIM